MTSKPVRLLLISISDKDAAEIVDRLKDAGYHPEVKHVDTLNQYTEAVDGRNRDFIIMDDRAEPNLIEVMDHQNRQGLNIPLIVVSDSPNEDRIVKAIKSGACNYISKRDLSRLATAVREELEGRPFGSVQDRRERRTPGEKRDAELYRMLFHTGADGIVITSVDGIILDANDAFLWMIGYTLEELRGKNVREVTPEKWHDIEADKIRDVCAGYGARRFEKEYVRKDGSVFPVSVSGWLMDDRKDSSQKMGAFVHDITAQKNAERALLESERRFKELAEMLPQTVFEINRDGKFIYVNRFGLEFSGYTQRDVNRGVYVFGLFPPEEQQRLKKDFTDVLNGQTAIGREYKLLKKNGETALVTVYASPMVKDGDTIGLRGITIDETEKKQMREYIARAQRLETAGRLAGQIAHDFNNLLAPIMAYPDIITAEFPDGHPALKYLNDIRTAAVRISGINQELLTLGRRGHYKQEIIDLNLIIEQTLDQLKPLPGKISLDLDLGAGLFNIKGGSSQIARVILNLIVNALDAMVDTGVLSVKTENYYVDITRNEYGRVPKGEYVKLTVSDSGCGIPPDIRSKIFDPFFSTKKADNIRGSGLGLSVVHTVLEDHGAHIDLKSEIGNGTAFYLYFPVSRESAVSPVPGSITGGDEKILVVDDDPMQCEVLLRLLNNLGYDGRAVESGEEALRLLEKEPFDLIIIDMIMPEGIDGTETFRRALEIDPEQKAVIISGCAPSARIDEALRLGAGSFINKPVTLQNLASIVREVLDRAEVTRAAL
jgi:two-component system cell cycle sensor histidine kinase/response regulator CckA